VALDAPRGQPDRVPPTGRREGDVRDHLPQIDVIRIVPMVGVVASHTLIFTQPVASLGAAALLMLLHANREVFFFATAFLLFHSTRDVGGLGWSRFWRRRYPLVLVPYLAWTLIYWLQTQNWKPWPPAAQWTARPQARAVPSYWCDGANDGLGMVVVCGSGSWEPLCGGGRSVLGGGPGRGCTCRDGGGWRQR